MPFTLPNENAISWLKAGENATGAVSPAGTEGSLNRPLTQLLANDRALLEIINGLKSQIDATTNSVRSTCLNTIFPIGSLYFNQTTPTHPGVLYDFGVWQQIAQGRVLLGAGTGNDGTNAINFPISGSSSTGANKIVSFTITSAETSISESYVININGCVTGVGSEPTELWSIANALNASTTKQIQSYAKAFKVEAFRASPNTTYQFNSWRGNYSNGQQYKVGDVVKYSSSYYTCTVAIPSSNNGNNPTNATYWTSLTGFVPKITIEYPTSSGDATTSLAAYEIDEGGSSTITFGAVSTVQPYAVPSMGSIGGEYFHQLVIDELPKHVHDFNVGSKVRKITAPNPNIPSPFLVPDYNTIQSSPTGGDKPHNNIQPYLTLYVFKRVS